MNDSNEDVIKITDSAGKEFFCSKKPFEQLDLNSSKKMDCWDSNMAFSSEEVYKIIKNDLKKDNQ
jgi:hypothetical protein